VFAVGVAGVIEGFFVGDEQLVAGGEDMGIRTLLAEGGVVGMQPDGLPGTETVFVS